MPQRKNKVIFVRAEQETIQNFKKSISENKVSTYGEGLKHLLTVGGSEVFQEYQECEFFSEYPIDSKHFIACSKSDKRVPQKRTSCQACKQNKETKVLMKSRGKIEQEISEGQHKLETVKIEIVRHTRGLKKIENFSNMPEQLKKKDKEIADLKTEIADLKSYLENALNEKKEENAQIVERVVEEKKTTEKFTPSPEQKKHPDLLCPKTKNFESVDDACKKCDVFATCPQYGEFMMLKKAIGGV